MNFDLERAMLVAARERYFVHVTCGGEVDAGSHVCAACGLRVRLSEIVPPKLLETDSVSVVTRLLARIDRLEKAIPDEHVRKHVGDALVAYGVRDHRTLAWLKSLDELERTT